MANGAGGHAAYEWTLGDRMRKAREAADYDQQDIADEIGISRNSVGNYESGRTTPRLLVLRAWAACTGVPLEWLETGIVPPDTDGPDVRHQGLEPRTRWSRVTAGQAPVREPHYASLSLSA